MKNRKGFAIRLIGTDSVNIFIIFILHNFIKQQITGQTLSSYCQLLLM